MEKSDDSLEYAKKKIEVARLDPAEVFPRIQGLSIGEGQDDLFLLQLNTDVQQHVAEGQVLTIRGDPAETAVICTETTTYELREAETSNSLLLMRSLLWPKECEKNECVVIPQDICGSFHNYFELRNFKPSFKKLKCVLEANAFRGKEFEDDTEKKYTLDDLLDFIQASKTELTQALDDLQTCILNGHIRLLDFDYKFSVLSQVIDVIESKSFPLNRISKTPVIESLQELIPHEILEKMFSWFAYKTDEVDDYGDKYHALNETAVCRIYAEILLRAAGKFHLSEFLESWQKSVPEGMKCDLSQLQGLALTDMNYSPEVIFHFPCDELPENVAERFAKLFKVKEKWSYDEIVPYLEDIALAGNDVKSLLIKYSRESTRNGIKVYSSKW